MMVNLSILIVPLTLSTVAGHLNVRYEWKYIDYVWKDTFQKQKAIDSGNYMANASVPIDVDRAPDGRIFVTIPRGQGVPATLTTVSSKHGEGGPLLKPYPDWSWNQGNDCNGITSVYRVSIKCNRLWVLDNGNNGERQVCPAQLLVFDLSNDNLLKRVKIPSNIAANENGTGLLITPVVETRGLNCRGSESNSIVYMADVEGYGLVVYNGRDLQRFDNPSFRAEENHATFTIAGETFYLTDGLFSLALQPKRHEGHSARLFYRPLASLSQYYVSTRQFGGDLNRPITPDYRTLDYAFTNQVTIQAFSPQGILFMGYTNPPAIACWNSYKQLNNENVVIVARDDEKLQFTSGLKLKGTELLAMTNRYQKVAKGTLNFEEVNFRILVERDIHDLLRGTKCSQ